MSTIDYFYSVRSVYAYFGAKRIAALARRFGRTLRHRPVDLSRVVPAAGSLPFSQRSPTLRAYQFGRELERWSEWLEIPVIIEPKHHYGDRDLPSGLVLMAQAQGQDVDALSEAILTALWRDDRDIADRNVLSRSPRASASMQRHCWSARWHRRRWPSLPRAPMRRSESASSAHPRMSSAVSSSTGRTG